MLEVLSENNIINGYPDGTFKPDHTINRAEALKVIFLAVPFLEADSENSENSSPFSDVKKNEWFSPYIFKAHTKNIVNGYPDGTFKPGQDVNRDEFIKMTMLALPFYDTIAGSEPSTQFIDLDQQQWYMESISKAFTLDFLPKTNRLELHKPMLRGDAAEMVYKVHQYLELHPEAVEEGFVGPESELRINPLDQHASSSIPKPAITFDNYVFETTAGVQIELPPDAGLVKSEIVAGQLQLAFDDSCFVDFLRYNYDGDPQSFYEENIMIGEYSMFPVEEQSWEKTSEKPGYEVYQHQYTYALNESVLAEIGLPKHGTTSYFITKTGYVLTMNGHSPQKEEAACTSHVEEIINGFSMPAY